MQWKNLVRQSKHQKSNTMHEALKVIKDEKDEDRKKTRETQWKLKAIPIDYTLLMRE